MSRINTNVQSQIAQRILTTNQASLAQSLERLSTGVKINRGKDDPAGLIASNALGSELRATNAAIQNAERADQVVNIAEGGLQEISGLLTDLQGLLNSTASKAGLSQDEKQANQLQIDSILQTIDRISSSSSFQGIKLLNGNFDFKTSGVATGVADFRINGAKFEGSSLNVNVNVTLSAQQAGLLVSVGGATLDIASNESFVLEISGSKGSRELSFSDGTDLTTIASTINQYTEITGVAASVSGSTGLKVYSSAYGSNEFVNVKVLDDGGLGSSTGGIYQLSSQAFLSADSASRTALDANNARNGIRDSGQDLRATVNGVAATANGRTLRVNTDFLDTEITLTSGTARSLGTTTAFRITGGGAEFQLASKIDVAGRVSLGIRDVAARKLGNSEIGYLSQLASGKANNVVAGDLDGAQKIVNESIAQISSLRGRLGAFQQNTIGATIRNLNVAAENTSAAQSVIRDADFAAETAKLTRAQILVSGSTNILSLANSQPQTVLQLLG
ncbi:MAG: flagellin [Planctomycetota bacterium]|nr:flagellin [Planctomycetota bacterium]